jgi:uncharacterized membrane protein
MESNRLKAFSDGVIAIIITIMVLELRAPPGEDLAALGQAAPTLLAYVLSFAILAIYWNNHHHLLHAASSIDASIMWANMHLLFWLSLIPYATSWLGQHYTASAPTAVYGALMLCCAIAYTILQIAIVRRVGWDSPLASRLGNDIKGKISMAAYALAIPIAFMAPYASDILFVAVALMWFIPDRRLQPH